MLALEGRRDGALAVLPTVVELGLPANTALQMENDSDLKSLHSDPQFDSLVASRSSAGHWHLQTNNKS